MRTALCISGHLRTFDRTFLSLYKNIIKPNNCDVFIHTWETLGYTGPVDGTAQAYDTERRKENILSMYQPKKIVIENSNGFQQFRQMGEGYNDRYMKVHPGYMFAMFYSLWQANLLKTQYENENNFVYDCVIRCRPDLMFETGIDIKRFVVSNPLDAIYVPNFGFYSGVNDQFAFSNSRMMNIYSELYNMIHTHCRRGCEFRPEPMLAFHLNHHRLPVKRCSIRYNILRFTGRLVVQQENSQQDIIDNPYNLKNHNFS